jgi:hypothetical protein
MAGTAGLLGLFNVADSDKVQGGFKAADVNGIKGNQFVLYEYFRGKAHVTDKNTPFKVDLPRLGYELVYVLPVTKGFAAFGLVNKYNAPATIVSEQWNGNGVSVKLYEGGMFKAYSVKKPASVRVNGKEKLFSFKDNLLNVTVDSNEKPVVEIRWK